MHTSAARYSVRDAVRSSDCFAHGVLLLGYLRIHFSFVLSAVSAWSAHLLATYIQVQKLKHIL